MRLIIAVVVALALAGNVAAAEKKAKTKAAEKPAQVKTVSFHTAPPAKAKRGGCGSKGGPGYRKENGDCASWDDARK